MKKSFFLLAILLVSEVCHAQKNELGIIFSEKSHDFGAISETDGRVTHIFKFTNAGESTVVLKSVRASCGCTTPNWTKSPIESGKEGEVAVTYNPANRPGSFTKTITVVIEGANKKQETVLLTISGEVFKERHSIKIQGLSLERQTISFKDVMQGRILTDTVSVYNNTNDPLTISFEKLPKYLSAKVIPNKPMAGQKINFLYPTQTGVLQISYDTKKSFQWGGHTDSLVFVLNGKSVREKSLRFRVFANLKEDFSKLTTAQRQKAPIAQLSQNKISFGSVKKGTGASFSVTLKNPGLSPLYIRYIDTFSEYLRVKPAKTIIESGKSTTLKIELIPYELPEINFRKRIELVTNDPSVPFQYITLDWDIVK